MCTKPFGYWTNPSMLPIHIIQSSRALFGTKPQRGCNTHQKSLHHWRTPLLNKSSSLSPSPGSGESTQTQINTNNLIYLTLDWIFFFIQSMIKFSWIFFLKPLFLSCKVSFFFCIYIFFKCTPTCFNRVWKRAGRWLTATMDQWDQRKEQGRDLVEANDVRMSQHFHDLHLPEDLLQIVVIQLRLVHDFNRHLRHVKRERDAIV